VTVVVKFVVREKVHEIAPRDGGGVVAGRVNKLWRQKTNIAANGKCAIAG
jgi:hypothetical protein